MLSVSENQDTNVTLRNYEPTFDGLIHSWVERFPTPDVSQILVELWNKDARHFDMEEIKK